MLEKAKGPVYGYRPLLKSRKCGLPRRSNAWKTISNKPLWCKPRRSPKYGGCLLYARCR